MPSEPLVRYDIADGIATITLDSPHNRNALSRRLLIELQTCLSTARDDVDVRGVMLTATGTTFCAGADLADIPGTAGEPSVSLPGILAGMWSFPKTIVLRLNGHVRAGGMGLVAAADIVIAPSTATFAFTEVRIGVAPAIIAVICARRMLPRALQRYSLTGETFDATAAAAGGLVTMAVPPDELESSTDAVLEAVRLTGPNAVRTNKELLVDLPAMSVEDGFSHAEAISLGLFRSAEAAEGIRAFKEKRRPSWAVGSSQN